MKKLTLITNWSCPLTVFKIPMFILTDKLQGIVKGKMLPS